MRHAQHALRTTDLPTHRTVNDPQTPPGDAPPPNAKPLSAADAAELVGRVAELSNAGLPLAPGLRAAAGELPKGRLAATLERIAAALERGQSLEQALVAERGALPRHLQALVTAGARTGKLGQVLEEFVHFRQQIDDIYRSVWIAVAYPAFLIVLLGAVALFFAVFVIPALSATAETYRTGPSFVKAGVDVCEWVSQHIAGLLVGAVIAIFTTGLAALLVGPKRRRQLLNQLPLFGPLWRFGALSEFAQLVRLLITNDVPLPDALRLAADGIRDADLAAVSRGLAGQIESGTPLAAAMSRFPQFTASTQPIVAWGERQSALPDALDAVAQMATRRVQLQADLVKAVVPPAAFLGVMTLLLFMLALVSQFIALIRQLTSYMAPSAPPPAPLPEPSFSGAVSLLVIGCAVLIAVRLVYPHRKPPADALQTMMRLVGWLLLALGVFGIFTVFTAGWALLLWPVAIGCWGSAVFRFRQSQRLALLNLLALSADRGISLEAAARAFGEEEGGICFSRSNALADCLAAGVPLSEAIQRNRRVLPPRSAVAARIGEVIGALGAALRSAVDRHWSAGLTRVAPVRVVSLVYLSWVAGFVVPFIAIKVGPAFEKIYSDFHEKLPPLTRAVFQLTASPYSFFFSLFLMILVVVVSIYVAVRGLGWIQFDLPIVARIMAPQESAVVLRWLGLVAGRGQPLEPALDYLADSYPRRLIRRRLRTAAADIAHGHDWADSFRDAKLVQKTDAAILKAAARVGNLPWALAEAASNSERRLNYRLNAIGQVLLPLLILAAGTAVMMFVVGCFLPLVQLINDLAVHK
jgi:type II secretory pathway component PulF